MKKELKQLWNNCNPLIKGLSIWFGLIFLSMSLVFAYTYTFCTETTIYPDLKARPVLIQSVNPVTGDPYGPIRIGSPYGPEFRGASTEELGFVPAQVIKKWEC